MRVYVELLLERNEKFTLRQTAISGVCEARSLTDWEAFKIPEKVTHREMEWTVAKITIRKEGPIERLKQKKTKQKQ